jgi:uncharacterized protein
MIKRQLTKQLQQAAKDYPIVSVLGPRQSGKTTLVKDVFKDYQYVNLENLTNREFALKDPQGFLEVYSNKVIIDETQNAPQLFSYLQVKTDEDKINGQYILTGSQHFLLMESISQSLAGRISLNTLLPLSYQELIQAKLAPKNYHQLIFKGGYPSLYAQKSTIKSWHSNYLQTFIERDIRTLKNVTNLSAFQSFIKLCAARTGQIVNLSALAKDANITHNTAKAWLSLLETSFIVFFLQPHHQNFNKRLIKSPKLYFYDTGLACWLLGIESEKQLSTHYLAGNLFESLIVSEYYKHIFHTTGLRPRAYFWRDKTGHEIDLVIEKSDALIPIEIKSGKTFRSSWLHDLHYWQKLAKGKSTKAHLVYGGNQTESRQNTNITPWQSIPKLFPQL